MLNQKELEEIRYALHQIPEIGLEEFETQSLILKWVRVWTKDREDVQIKTWKTGILIKISGTVGRRTIAWRTDMDGLPVDEETGLSCSSQHEGRMHACGHDVHMTVALGLLKLALEHPTENHRLFLFQPAEENHGGAKLMYEAGCFEEKWSVDEFYALHVNPNLKSGVIATRPSTLFAGTCEVHVKFTGESGHAAFPQDANDMLIASTSFVQISQTIISRNVNPVDSAVLTFGHLEAGQTVNVIAGDAKLDGTIRAFIPETLEKVKDRLQDVAEGIEKSFNCKVEVNFIQGAWLPVVNDHALTEKFINFCNARGNFQEIEALMTGEDFGYLLQKFPGMMFWLGVDGKYPLHHSKMSPDISKLEISVALIHDWIYQRANAKKIDN